VDGARLRDRHTTQDTKKFPPPAGHRIRSTECIDRGWLRVACCKVLMSVVGQTEKKISVRAYVFRFALELGHRSMLRRDPFRPFLADFIEARVRLRERRPIKVCEGSIASVCGVTVVDRAVTQRWQRVGNYAVRFCPIASNCAFCSSLSVA
jgi:hypothetical protein